jgi:hypothetical protein
MFYMLLLRRPSAGGLRQAALSGFIGASKTSRWRFAPHHPIASRTDTGMRRLSVITAPRVGFGELSHTYQPPLAYYHILPLHFALTSLREFHVRPFSALSNTFMNRTPKRQSFGMRRDITSRDLENRVLRDSHCRMTSADSVCQSIGDVSVLPASHHRSFAKLRVFHWRDRFRRDVIRVFIPDTQHSMYTPSSIQVLLPRQFDRQILATYTFQEPEPRLSLSFLEHGLMSVGLWDRAPLRLCQFGKRSRSRRNNLVLCQRLAPRGGVTAVWQHASRANAENRMIAWNFRSEDAFSKIEASMSDGWAVVCELTKSGLHMGAGKGSARAAVAFWGSCRLRAHRGALKQQSQGLLTMGPRFCDWWC